jgi:UDP-2,3-diacylglucosamine pyrophosphatase LpxH
MMAHETRRRGCDGVVCGHIHKAEIKMIDGILYCNDGDWVESLTAMVEHADGRLEIVHWNDIKAAVPERQLRITKVSVNIERILESTE